MLRMIDNISDMKITYGWEQKIEIDWVDESLNDVHVWNIVVVDRYESMKDEKWFETV